MRSQLLISLAAVLALASCASTRATATSLQVSSTEVSYSAGAASLEGYIARPSGAVEKRPGVIVVHEWWGHNEYARRRARELAEQGYVALAVDMYGEGKTASHPSDASAFMAEVTGNAAVMEARFRAGLELLHAQPDVDPSKTGAVGFCMGGAVCLNMLRLGVDLDAVASIHGLLDSDIEAVPVATPRDFHVLAASGGDDPMAPEASVIAFETEMSLIPDVAEIKTIVFPGVLHAFSNPDATRLGEEFGLPLRYDADADRKSWQATLELFASAL